MTHQERHRRLHELYVAATALRDEERGAFVARLRAADPALGDELQSLLDDVARGANDPDDDTSALAELLGADGVRAAQPDLEAIAAGPWQLGALPTRIDGFRIVRRIGQGGMGVVFEAEQDNPRRRVALKLMQPALGTERLRRFELEAAVLGRLHHPNIAQIYACGTLRGDHGEQPYFAMELIDGVDLRTHAERNRLDRTARLVLFAQVADAVHHAHERGVVHRDLKPDNVLVDTHGAAKVLDFGVARAKDSSLDLASMATQAGELIGTLSYMAPEQLAGDPDAVSARSDVYSLGVMLYELLSHRLPHEVAGLPIAAAIFVLGNQPPAPLARFDAQLRGDLATIVAKALERDPARRYATAAALAADIRRHLGNLPIHARPASITYRVTTMLRRNRALAIGLGAAFAALSLGLVGTVWQAHAASVERDHSRRQAYSANLLGAGDALARAEFAATRAFLEAAPDTLRGWEWRALRAQLDTEVEIHQRSLPTIKVDDAPGFAMVPVTGGNCYWMLHGDRGAVSYLWERTTGRLLATLPAVEASANLGMSGDGTRLFRYRPCAQEKVHLETFDARTGTSLRDLIVDVPAYQQGGRTWSSPDDRFLFYGAADGIARVDLLQQQPRALVPLVGDFPNVAAWRPDGRVIAVVASNNNPPVHLIDAETLQVTARLTGHENGQTWVGFSPDGSLLATTSSDQTARVWDLATSPPTCRFVLQHPLEVARAAFSPDQRLLATSCVDRVIRVFRIADGALLGSFGASDLLPPALAFFDEHTVGGIDSTGTVHFWDVDAAATARLRGHRAPVELLELLPRFGLLASGGADGLRGHSHGLKFWDVDSGDLVAECLPEGLGATDIALAANGTTLWLAVNTIGGHPDLQQLDVRTGTFTPQAGESMDSWRLAIDPSNQNLATSDGAALEVRGADSGTVQRSTRLGDRVTRVSLHWLRAGQGILFGLGDRSNGGARLLDEQTLRETRRFSSSDVLALAVDRDERRLAIAGSDSIVRIFDIGTGALLSELRGHDLEVYCLAFSPDGKRLASAGLDRGIRLWDTATWDPVARLGGHEDAVMDVVWDGDERLISAAADNTVRVWETAPLRTRVAARTARRAALARIEPLVAALFAELRSGERVFDRIAADATLGDLDRRVAHQVALRTVLAPIAGK